MSIDPVTDDDLMLLALEEARAAGAHGDTAGRYAVSGRGHNRREHRGDPPAHA